MDSAEQESVVFWQLYKKGLLDSEFDQIVPLFVRAFPQQSLHLVKAPSHPLDDLTNLKLIASGQIGTALMSKLGAAPLSIALTDTYEALQRGTADGVNFPISSLPDFKLDEVTHYHIDVPLGGGPGGIWMAKAEYEGLPPDVRKVLDDNSGEAASRRSGTILDQMQTVVTHQLQTEPNQQIVKLTPEQQAQWKAKIDPMVDAWANTDDAHRKVVAAVRELAAAFSSQQ
jgi:TRAP-type C4-dicarboxylate transport system substrate-binding protein